MRRLERKIQLKRLGAEMERVAALISNFDRQLRTVDPTAQIALTGHLLIEEQINSILEQYAFHPRYLEGARLQFYQKVELCRGFALGKSELSIWRLILAINRVRNSYAHSLNKTVHTHAMAALTAAYNLECSTSSARQRLPVRQDERTRVKLACAMCLGFLDAFAEDSRAFRAKIKRLRSKPRKGGVPR
jgi:hypothetical protein